MIINNLIVIVGTGGVIYVYSPVTINNKIIEFMKSKIYHIKRPQHVIMVVTHS